MGDSRSFVCASSRENSWRMSLEGRVGENGLGGDGDWLMGICSTCFQVKKRKRKDLSSKLAGESMIKREKGAR